MKSFSSLSLLRPSRSSAAILLRDATSFQQSDSCSVTQQLLQVSHSPLSRKKRRDNASSVQMQTQWGNSRHFSATSSLQQRRRISAHQWREMNAETSTTTASTAIRSKNSPSGSSSSSNYSAISKKATPSSGLAFSRRFFSSLHEEENENKGAASTTTTDTGSAAAGTTTTPPPQYPNKQAASELLAALVGIGNAASTAQQQGSQSGVAAAAGDDGKGVHVCLLSILEAYALKRKVESDSKDKRLWRMGMADLFGHPDYGKPIFYKQIDSELASVELAVEKFEKSMRSAAENGAGGGTSAATKLIREWFEPLRSTIEREQAAIIASLDKKETPRRRYIKKKDRIAAAAMIAEAGEEEEDDDALGAAAEEGKKVSGKPKIKDLEEEAAIDEEEEGEEGEEDKKFVPKGMLDRQAYGPYLLLLPPEKLAVITLNTALSTLLDDPMGETVVRLACLIAENVEVEYALHSRKAHANNVNHNPVQSNVQEMQNQLALHYEPIEVQKRRKQYFERLKSQKKFGLLLHAIQDHHNWGLVVRCQVGTALLALLMQSAKIENYPAFVHSYEFKKNMRKYGTIKLHVLALRRLEECNAMTSVLFPQYSPMLIRPAPWVSPLRGGYLTLPVRAMKIRAFPAHIRLMQEHHGKFDIVYKALNVLGNTKWRINVPVYNAILKVWNDGGGKCGIPFQGALPPPAPPIRTPEMTDVDWRQAEGKYKFAVKKANKETAERVSLRCDFLYKLTAAKNVLDEEFYSPHNLDFRGRAYPIPIHLSHLGSDLARGMLVFGVKKQLGARGLQWLKRHLASVYGYDKVSFEEREKWTEENIALVCDVASDPFGKNKDFWMTADSPWQVLATCFELGKAMQLENPEEFMSSLPIHQDGSCNGLQHYAALGRDPEGGKSVNLLPADRPSDPYRAVAMKLADFVEKQAEEGHPLASLLKGHITRKIVKQTVMTSVYGVTFVGARAQIQDKIKSIDSIPENMLYPCACYLAEHTLKAMHDSFVGLRTTMSWLAELARLVARAGKPMQWVTPLGLPIIQPYTSTSFHRINTLVQTLSLTDPGDITKPLARKQASAFPPNFIHSLDSSHMMMTAVACSDAGLEFAGVHDSFWTHACDVDTMSVILRQKFIDLHSRPILEDLLKYAKAQVPDLPLERVPERGDLDVSVVAKSTFFFS